MMMTMPMTAMANSRRPEFVGWIVSKTSSTFCPDHAPVLRELESQIAATLAASVCYCSTVGTNYTRSLRLCHKLVSPFDIRQFAGRLYPYRVVWIRIVFNCKP